MQNTDWLRFCSLLPPALLALATWARACGAADLTELPLDDLLNIEITSASKRPERLSDSAAAVFVLSQEDIRRSGATSLPELLRGAPGVEVARINASNWAVSIRGFNGRFANKLLVLIDGRSVYTPLFSGVFWNEQDLVLEDIERIEIIRGPGASLWGSNAVNGVINIITKHAATTQGNLATLGVGTEDHGLATARHGGRLGDNVHYRVYAKGFRRIAPDSDSEPTWKAGRVGFRLDGAPDIRNAWMLNGDIHQGRDEQIYSRPTLTAPFSRNQESSTGIATGHLLGRWEHQASDLSMLSLQAYYDRASLQSPLIHYERHTADLTVENMIRLTDAHNVVWGLGYRTWWDRVDADLGMSFSPREKRAEVVSGFVQDTIELLPKTLNLTLGTKLEYEGELGAKLQPTARVLWHVDNSQTLWTAVSRAIRTPSRAERSIGLDTRAIPGGSAANPSPVPAMVSLFGNDRIDAEGVTAYELGYRFQAGNTLSLEIASFYNVYEDLIGVRTGTPFLELMPAPPHLVLPFVATNGLEGETYGFEVSATWQVLPAWRLKFGYGLLQTEIRATAPGTLQANANVEGTSPRHQASLHVSGNLSETVTLDANLRYVDDLPALGIGRYVTLDARLAWQPTDNLEFGIIGRNLMGSHLEFGSEAPLASPRVEVGPSLLGTVRWSF